MRVRLAVSTGIINGPHREMRRTGWTSVLPCFDRELFVRSFPASKYSNELHGGIYPSFVTQVMNQLRGDNKQYTSRSAGLTNFPSSQPHELRANRV